MKAFHLSLGAVMLVLATLAVNPPAVAQYKPYNRNYEEVRGAVQRTQEDLTRVRRLGSRNDKERERLDNARKHLSDFDRNLSKNRFDKGRLDSAIDDVKNVVENNTLEARDRDALTADLADLRRIRAMRGE